MNKYWIITYPLIVLLMAAHSCGSSSVDSRKFEDSDLDEPVFQSAQPKDTSRLVGTWLVAGSDTRLKVTYKKEGVYQYSSWTNDYWEQHGDSIFIGKDKNNFDLKLKIDFLTMHTMQYSFVSSNFDGEKEVFRKVIRHAIRIPSKEVPDFNLPKAFQGQ